MKQKLINWGKRQSFQPDFFGILVNPLFLLRLSLYRAIRKNAPELGGTLLDFGCGRKPYQNLFNVSQYVGLDMEQTGHDHSLSVVDVFYDGKTIPFQDQHFDSVFCGEVLEHVFTIDESLQEIHRIMKPGAKGLFTIPFAWNEHEQPYDFGRYTSFGIRSVFERNGFEVIRIEKSGHFTLALWQLWSVYLYERFRTKHKIANALLTTVFIFPVNLLGWGVTWLLPKDYTLYCNNIVLVRKE